MTSSYVALHAWSLNKWSYIETRRVAERLSEASVGLGDGCWWLEWRGVMEMVYSKCTLYPWPPITRSQGVGHGDNGIQGRRRFTRLHPLISPFCIAGEEDRTPPQLWLCWGATAWWLVLSTGVWAMPGPGPSPEEWPSPAADRHQFLVHPAHRQAFCNALLNLA